MDRNLGIREIAEVEEGEEGVSVQIRPNYGFDSYFSVKDVWGGDKIQGSRT